MDGHAAGRFDRQFCVDVRLGRRVRSGREPEHDGADNDERTGGEREREQSGAAHGFHMPTPAQGHAPGFCEAPRAGYGSRCCLAIAA